MYSLIINGEVKDFKFCRGKKLKCLYNFYVGDIFFGQIFNMGKTGWCAVSWAKDPVGFKSVKGFKTRFDAAQYIIRTHGYKE